MPSRASPGRTSRSSTAPQTTAAAVEKLLSDEAWKRAARAPQRPRFLVTDAPDRFARVGEIFLGEPIDPGTVELVDLQ